MKTRRKKIEQAKLDEDVVTERPPEAPDCGRCGEPFACTKCGCTYLRYGLRPEDSAAMRTAFAYENAELKERNHALETALFAMVDAALEGEERELLERAA